MAADFYKQFFLIGSLYLILITVNCKGETLTLTHHSSTLNEVSFNISTVSSTLTSVTLTDAYILSKNYPLFNYDNKAEYFGKVTNLTYGSLFTLTAENSKNEIRSLNISTVPGSVTNLVATDISFTSARITWDQYVPPQKKEAPKYKLLYETDPILAGQEPIQSVEENNYKNLSNLKPATKYKVNLSVFLYKHSGQTKSIEFSTPPVLPPNVMIVAVNTSALNVTWTIKKPDSIYPEYVNIISEKSNVKCLYSKTFCVVEIGGKPGKTHKLSIYSSISGETSKEVDAFHPTKPLPPSCLEKSNSTSLTLHCSPSESDFYFYLIDFYKNKDDIIRIPRNGFEEVTTTFGNLQSNKGYTVILSSLSGTEESEKSSKMFFTNPSLDQATIDIKGNHVIVSLGEYFDTCSMCLYTNNISKCEVIFGNNVKFDEVKAGIKYLLNVSCNAKWSQPREVIVPPLPPTDIKVSPATRSIDVSWNFNDSRSLVELWFISVNGYTYNVTQNKREYRIQNLTSGTDYNISISSYAAGKTSLIKTKFTKTYPECMATLQKVSITTSSITVDVSQTTNSFDYYEFELRHPSGITEIRNVSKDETTVEFSDLPSGMQYDIRVRTIRGNLKSEPCESTITTRTYPECMATLQKVSITTSSITVNVSQTTNSFDYYEFELQNQSGIMKTKHVSKDDRNVIFSNLEAGTQYNISVRTMSGNLKSQPCKSTITARTKPSPPIVSCQPNEREIHVRLTKSSGYIDGFEIICEACQNFTTKRLNSTGSTSLNIFNLQPNEMYFIIVKTFAGNLWSEIGTCNSTTNESGPSKVLDLKVEEVGTNIYNLTWKKPSVTNGLIRLYLVEFIGRQEGTNKRHDLFYNCSDEFQEVELKPGYVYNITVKAFTVMEGPGQSIIFTSKTYAPEIKPNLSRDMKQPNKSKTGQRSFVVEFPTNPFTEVNGRILNYTVIVATTNETSGNGPSVLPNWYQFNKNPSINAYQPISNCTNLYEVGNTCDKKMKVSGRTKRSTEIQSVKFEIGVDDCSKENTLYCNGYLEAGTKYYVKVRAYTRDAFQDTPFSEAIWTESEAGTKYYVKVRAYTQNAFKDTPFSEAIWTESEELGLPSYGVALAVIFPLVTLFFVGFAIYCVKKGRLS